MTTLQASNETKKTAELFNSSILDRLPKPKISDDLLIRPLASTDYDKGFIQLLSQLSDVGNIAKDQFLNIFYQMKNSGYYYIVIIEDLKINRIIAAATLVVEQKFIHNCALKGRLEDVVVNNNYRGKHLGKLVVSVISQLAQHLHCYKLSLDCKDKLIPFYESLGFKREPNNANSLNLRFPVEVGVDQSRL
ncbi:probable glucosamine 6-phosphate N-acetyltransferase [Prorops nasuta]|uniref:probable glucosamine 6-phosphate N-acetyltransferase n=1 Tax=Prorops nasuta TaxID=863751 RepID=UPI0034CD9F16